MAISPDQERLVTNFGPSDGTIQVWDLHTGAQLGQLKGHRAWVSALVFWPDGKTLASASADQTIRIWDMDRLEPIRTLRGHKLEVWSLALASDAKTLVSGGKDGTVLVWDAAEDPLEQSTWSLSGRHWGSWQFTSDHQAIHSVEADSRLRPLHLHSGPIESCRLIHHSGPTFQNAEPIPEVLIDGVWIFSESGRLLAVGQTNGLLRLWDLDARKLVREFSTGTGECQPVAFSPGETEIWIAQGFERPDEPRKLTQWSLEKQQLLRTAPPFRWPFRLHPDNWLFWQEEQGSFVFHDLKTGKSSRPTLTTGRWSDLVGHMVGASPDGKLLILLHDLGVLTVWETASLRRWRHPHVLRRRRVFTRC
jgi:WD40 repeat protein